MAAKPLALCPARGTGERGREELGRGEGRAILRRVIYSIKTIAFIPVTTHSLGLNCYAMVKSHSVFTATHTANLQNTKGP